jgi:hypothetical protein
MRNLIFVLLIFAGCYTIIKHPEVNYEDSSGGVYTSHVSYRSNCSSCHSRAELDYFYDLMPAHNASAWAYYNYPWWFSLVNMEADTVSGSSTGSVFERTREFGTHRTPSNESFSPPPPSRTPSGSDSSSKSSSTGSISKGSEVKSEGARSSGNLRSSDGNSREQNKESEQNKEGKRNIGSRRK